MSSPAESFAQALLSFVLQLGVFAAIPFVVYVARERRVKGFGEWVGLKRAPSKVILMALVAALVLTSIQVPLFRALLDHEGTVSGELLDLREAYGPSAWIVGILLVNACLKTSLTEELFFRGFVGARLIAWFGFRWGNALQALLFGAIHLALLGVMPPEARTVTFGAVIVATTGFAGWLMGYMNHAHAGGSIFPSWAMHALGNTVAYSIPLLTA